MSITEGLAYTEMRIGEFWEVTRGDVHFETGEIRVAGDPEEATNYNGEVRYVPLIPKARKLFTRMLAEWPDEDSSAKRFKLRESQKSINRAAKIAGMARITRHDLRHYFATICIEARSISPRFADGLVTRTAALWRWKPAFPQPQGVE